MTEDEHWLAKYNEMVEFIETTIGTLCVIG